MHNPTITYPAEFQISFPSRFSRKERYAVETLQVSYRNLLARAEQALTGIQIAENHFNCLLDPTEIDSCIYRLRSAQCDYASTLARLKTLKMRMENLLNN